MVGRRFFGKKRRVYIFQNEISSSFYWG